LPDLDGADILQLGSATLGDGKAQTVNNQRRA